MFGWSVEVVAEWLGGYRDLFRSAADIAFLWPTERAARLKVGALGERFAAYRDALGLPAELGVRWLRHSYVTHLIEAGYDPLFVQLLLSSRGVVHHEPKAGGNPRRGGGYLRPSMTRMPGRSDAGAAGADARLVA